MPPAADADQARLIGDRAGEAAAPVAEQLAVGQIAVGRRAVVGQEHRRAALRADVDRARDQLLAGAALAGDQHGQVVALQPLDLLDDAAHRGAGAEEAGQQRLERALDRRRRRRRAPAARAPRTARSPAARRRRSSAAAASTGWPIGRGERDQRDARAVAVAAERLDDHARRGRRRGRATRRARERARGVGVAAGAAR